MRRLLLTSVRIVTNIPSPLANNHKPTQPTSNPEKEMQTMTTRKPDRLSMALVVALFTALAFVLVAVLLVIAAGVNKLDLPLAVQLPVLLLAGWSMGSAFCRALVSAV